MTWKYIKTFAMKPDYNPDYLEVSVGEMSEFFSLVSIVRA